MKKFIDPFLCNAPRIDIHGVDRTIAVALIKEFIDDYIRIDKRILVIVHGKGEGILKNATHEYLKKDKRVKEYYICNYNDGETIVILK